MIESGSCTEVNARENGNFGWQAVSLHRLSGVGSVHKWPRDPVKTRCVADENCHPRRLTSAQVTRSGEASTIRSGYGQSNGDEHTQSLTSGGKRGDR